ncbi:alpha/beta-hydrolase [Xylariomycetidae sp. FL0641]|nr:alpha/beta-hydrolase [Xylariomycetidae sp. FL0641]
MADAPPPLGCINTDDGVRLRYTQYGPSSAPNLLFVPGWAQTAAQFQKQVDYFQTNFRITTYDHRGHGDSDKPDFGYRVTRLAADLHALMVQLDLREVTVVGHSMGCSVIWAFWDLFTHERISKLVLVDQAPVMTANPAWTPEEAMNLAAIFPPAQAYELANAFSGPEGKASFTQLARGFFTADISSEDFEWTLEQNGKMSLSKAGALLIDHASMDWRDVIPRISVPTLVVAPEGSIFSTQGMHWIAKQIPEARLVSFKKEDGGSHFVLWENPLGFNRVVEEFLGEKAVSLDHP